MGKVEEKKKPPYLAIVVLFTGSVIALLNNSLINVALPSLMEDLHIKEYSTVQWLVTAYMLVSGVLMPVSAFLITKYSNRKLFITTLTIFGLGTLLAAFSTSFSVLLAGRVLQAIGAASISPLLMNVMLVSFPVEKRGTVMGFYGLALVFAPSLGPTLSGFIIEHYDWHYLFIMMLPIIAISLILAIWKLPNVLPTKESSLDFLSLVLSTVGFGSMLYGFSSAGNYGWSDPRVYGLILFGLVGVACFVIRQFKLEQPMLNLRVFKYPIYAHSIVLSAIVFICLNSFMVLIPQYLQLVRGLTPMESGLVLLPSSLLMACMFPVTGRLFDRFGPKKLVITGLTITTFATYLLHDLTLDTSTSYIVWCCILRGFGMSMVTMPIMTNGINQLPQKLNPHGTATSNTSSQVAGSLGVAVIVTFMSSTTKDKAAELAAEAKAKLIESGIAASPSAEQLAQMKATIAKESLLQGINTSYFIIVMISLLAVFVSFFIRKAVPNKVETQVENSQLTNGKMV